MTSISANSHPPRYCLCSVLAVVVLSTLLTLGMDGKVWADEKGPAIPQVQYGRLLNIRAGSYVEGSVNHGGLQPPYFIDVHEQAFKDVLQKSKAIGDAALDFWNKVSGVIGVVRDVFQKTDYCNSDYLALMKTYRDRNLSVPLSNYVALRLGTCREISLVLHQALKAANIPNWYAYTFVSIPDENQPSVLSGDHALIVLNYEGTYWVVDAYRKSLNGFRLEDLTSPGGVTESSQGTPFAERLQGTRRIHVIHPFPRVSHSICPNLAAAGDKWVSNAF